jgi:predicted RNA-binding protein YlxR (DUF448 family)
MDEGSAISGRKCIATEQTRQAIIDPVIMKQREDHFASLADIAKRFVSGLENVSRPDWITNNSGREVYVVPNADSASGYDEITEEQLSERLSQNMKLIIEYKDRFFRSCFIPHVKNELPQEMKTKLFFEAVEDHPFEIIECVKPLALGKPFQGICPRCKYWSQPFACPISHA